MVTKLNVHEAYEHGTNEKGMNVHVFEMYVMEEYVPGGYVYVLYVHSGTEKVGEYVMNEMVVLVHGRYVHGEHGVDVVHEIFVIFLVVNAIFPRYMTADEIVNFLCDQVNVADKDVAETAISVVGHVIYVDVVDLVL